MNTRTRLSTMLSLTLLLPAAAASQHFPPDEELTALIQSRVEDGGAMGIVLGVVEADGSTRIVSYGDAGHEARPLGSTSVFEIGSITKVFTGILLSDMVERGEVALSDPVSKHLPDGVTVPSRNGRQITLLDLTTHRSSITRMPTNMIPDGTGAYRKYTIDMMYEFLSTHELRRDIGVEFEYSNIAVALLGHVLSRVGGGTYEEVLRERVLDPLGMRMTSTRVEGAVREWMTVGHDDRGLVAPYRNWPELPGMGAIRSNAEDLLVFLAANARVPESRLGRVLQDAHEARNTMNDDTDIGLNWFVRNIGSSKIIWHGGATQGFRAFAGFDPETRVGAVLLANSPAAITDIGLHLINPEIPLSSAPVVDRVEIAVADDVLKTYVGDYELRPGFAVNVTLEPGGLFAQATGQRGFAIFPESETKFFARDLNIQLSFVTDTSGAVSRLIVHQNGSDRSASRRIAPGIPLASAAEIDASLPGRKASIASSVLGEDRMLRILTPDGYELSMSSRYPVLFVLEGERPTQQASGVVRSLAGRELGPDMIVVHTVAPTVEGRQAFWEFVTDELQPWIETEYRAAGFSVVVGESEVIAEAPASFAATIAIGADNEMRASFQDGRTSSTSSGDPHIALQAGLEWLFGGWELSNIAALASQPGDDGWAQIDAHYAELSARFGYRVVPHEDVADVAARAHAGGGRWDEALREMERNSDLHPGSARVFNHLGDLYRALCRREASLRNYSKAHEMAQAMKYANVSNYTMELGRITSEIESDRACRSPAEDRPEVEVAREILETYVGEYEFSSRFSVVVTLESGRLWVQATGQSKSPIFAESETIFFSKAIIAEFTFAKDDDGTVTGMTLHQNGRDAPGRRIRE